MMMMLDKTTWEDSESWVTPLLNHFTHRSRLTSRFHHFCWLRGCVTASLQECFRHVFRYARAAYPGWSRGSGLGGALVSAQSFVGSFTCLSVWRCLFSLLNFWFNVSRHTADSTVMHKPSLFFNRAGPFHNACFALCGLCLLFGLFAFSDVASCLCFVSCFSALWLPSRTVKPPFHCWVHGCAVLAFVSRPNSYSSFISCTSVLIDLAKAKRRWTEKKSPPSQLPNELVRNFHDQKQTN